MVFIFLLLLANYKITQNSRYLGIIYENINAEENVELTMALGITKAPTLLVPTNEGYDVYSNASEIKGYIEGLK